jgi:uncharacterized MAPEG superfamily protein
MSSIMTSWFNRGYIYSTCYLFHLAYVRTLCACSSVWEANRTLTMTLPSM